MKKFFAAVFSLALLRSQRTRRPILPQAHPGASLAELALPQAKSLSRQSVPPERSSGG